MSKKTFFAAFVAALLVLIASETPNVAAQVPLAHGATYLDNQWHTTSPDATLWYAFVSAGDRNTVTLRLMNGVQLGMLFNVYAPDKPSDQPIGRGTSSLVPCNNGDKCPSPDLTWTGGAISAGTYYVEVINKTSVAKSFLLTSSNLGVTTPAQTTVVYVSPYIAPYTSPYVQPYAPPSYVQPNVPQYTQPYGVPYYGQPYAQPYYMPGSVSPAPRYPKSSCCYPYYSPYYHTPQYGYPYYR
ncbi:MAG: hypothetical protein HY868_02425 [Chloroflexi bacterium]|nr:hypothetical protein [Chloroflexota bacterium]